MNWQPFCTKSCWARPTCEVCGRPKKPQGRDSMDNGLCDPDCDGYYDGEQPGHLWPDERPPAPRADAEAGMTA